MKSRFGSGGTVRSGVLLGTGFVIGFAIAWVARPSETGIGPVRGTAEERRAAVDARPGSRYAAAEEASRIILGDITRVPFQELYSVLSVRSPEELAKIAQQLNALPPGIDTTRRITAFFKAWGHLDARSALASAVTLGTVEARATAINSVIDAADASAVPALAETINHLGPEELSARSLASNTGKRGGEVE